MSKSKIFCVLNLFAAIAILSGCQSTRVWPVGLSKEIQNETQFSLVSDGGSITAIGTDTSECKIYAFTNFVPKNEHLYVMKYSQSDHKDIEQAFTFTSDGQNLVLNVNKKPSDRITIGDIDYVILLPKNMDFSLYTKKGDIKAMNFSENKFFQMKTAKGDGIVYGIGGQGTVYGNK